MLGPASHAPNNKIDPNPWVEQAHNYAPRKWTGPAPMFPFTQLVEIEAEPEVHIIVSSIVSLALPIKKLRVRSGAMKNNKVQMLVVDAAVSRFPVRSHCIEIHGGRCRSTASFNMFCPNTRGVRRRSHLAAVFGRKYWDFLWHSRNVRGSICCCFIRDKILQLFLN